MVDIQHLASEQQGDASFTVNRDAKICTIPGNSCLQFALVSIVYSEDNALLFHMGNRDYVCIYK